MTNDRYYLGLDLGQAADYTALAVVRRVPPPDWTPKGALTDRPNDCRYEVVALERYPLGTPYPEIVRRVGSLLECDPLREPRAGLYVDATGVGMPVVDMFRRAGLKPVAMTITGGLAATRQEGGGWHVPKRDLASVLQVLLQSGRLKVAAALPEAATLRRELLNFRVRITPAANETYGAWREGQHDDTVLAVALACWAGENIIKRQIYCC